MNLFVQLFETGALLAPDLVILGLIVPGVFSFYCLAKSLGLSGTMDMQSALEISLILGYWVSVAMTLMNSVTGLKRSRGVISSGSKPDVQQSESACLPDMPQSQEVKSGSVIIES